MCSIKMTIVVTNIYFIHKIKKWNEIKPNTNETVII